MEDFRSLSVSGWAVIVPYKILNIDECVHSMTHLLGIGAALRCAGRCEKKCTSLDLVDLQ